MYTVICTCTGTDNFKLKLYCNIHVTTHLGLFLEQCLQQDETSLLNNDTHKKLHKRVLSYMHEEHNVDPGMN